tara:strand:+ start:265 stop:1230 length:966 start_codon:yes stop_codon:yes gene_type:complete
MAFQDIVFIEEYKHYIDVAFRKSNKQAAKIRGSKIRGTRLDKSWRIELSRIEAIKASLEGSLMKILRTFPTIDDLPEFYKELLKLHIEIKQIKKSLGAINWAINKINDFQGIYSSKVKTCKQLAKINQYRREYSGRINSVLRQVRKDLIILQDVRKLLINFPVIKEKYDKVAICGFPNVGKTTLLSKLSKSKPEINEYAFTTKKVNVGYFEGKVKGKDVKVQLLDTPGTLNRYEKMNYIEKQAHLAIKYCADVLVYVFDLTEPYSLKKQIKLYKELKRNRIPMVVYLSKTDILDKAKIDEFVAEHKFKVYDFDELKKELLK